MAHVLIPDAITPLLVTTILPPVVIMAHALLQDAQIREHAITMHLRVATMEVAITLVWVVPAILITMDI
jgi:hypothetical protein